MKLSLPRTDLLAAMGVVRPIAHSSTLPILSHVLLTANEKSLTLAATNLDVFLRHRVDAVVNDKGEIAAPAALLHDIARNTTGQDVIMETGKHDLSVVCGDARFKLAVLDPKEFPGFPRVKDPIEFTLEDSPFRAMLAATAFAASSDESRFVLNGALLQNTREAFQVVTTDGRRLALTVADRISVNPFDCILPSMAVKELLRLLGEDVDKPRRLAVAIGATQAQLTWGDTALATKLIEGSYPNYRQVIPGNSPIATFDRTLILGALDRIALVADDIKLRFTKRALQVNSHGMKEKTAIGQATDQLLVPCSRECECLMAVDYLRQALAAAPDSTVTFHQNGDNGVIKLTAGQWQAVIAGKRDDPSVAKAPSVPTAAEKEKEPKPEPKPEKPAPKAKK